MSYVNWFPGHMAKTLKQIQKLPNIELVIEVVDARCMQASSNPLLTRMFSCPRLTIALKADLADLRKVKPRHDLLIGTLKNRLFRNEILKKIHQIFQHKIEVSVAGGLIQPHFHLLVVGLPNVGKSSLINFLAQKQKAYTQNRPGITRNKHLVRLDDYFYAYDTPGIFVKKVDTLETGYILALIGSVNKDVVPISDVAEWAYTFLTKHYAQKLFAHYNIKSPNMRYEQFILNLCQQYHFVNAHNVYDTTRAIRFFYEQIINNQITLINYEN